MTTSGTTRQPEVAAIRKMRGTTMMGFGFGAMGLGLVLMLLFWVGVILLAVWAVRSLFPGRRQSESDGALEVLRRRYAAGEISAAEYEQALAAIGQPAARR